MSNQKVSRLIAESQAVAVVVALAAAALAIFAVFQQAFHTTDRLTVVYNDTLIQKESGWPILGCAAGVVVSAGLYRLDKRRAMLWAMLVAVLGAAIYAATVYQVTGGRDGIEGSSNLLMLVYQPHGFPSTGLHLGKAAGLLAMVSGLVLVSCLSYLPSPVTSVQGPGIRGRTAT
jgi:hypothetical protein